MGALTIIPAELEPLPKLIDQAAAALASARTSAHVLEAKEQAAAIYDAAARITRKKQAHDDVMSMALRLQGQALKIEARAKERLADEYDAAQDRGEVGQAGQRTDLVNHDYEVKPVAADVFGSREALKEARRIRDAERADPGAIERCIEARVAEGKAPTRAALKRDLGIAPPLTPRPAPVDLSEIEITDAEMDRLVDPLVGVITGDFFTGLGMPGHPDFPAVARAVARGGHRRAQGIRPALDQAIAFLSAIREEIDRHD
jgi:hypothetical protein